MSGTKQVRLGRFSKLVERLEQDRAEYEDLRDKAEELDDMKLHMLYRGIILGMTETINNLKEEITRA